PYQAYQGQQQHQPQQGHGEQHAYQGYQGYPQQEQQTYPSWVTPVGTQEAPPQRPGRGKRVLVTGAAALLLALVAGGAGAWTALAFNENGGNGSIQTANSSVTRVVDRSSLAQIASSVQDSVVSIATQSGEGSGVILSADGYIVTNNHVVATAQGDTVSVIFAN